MPRGVKREINYESELAEIDRKITRHKEQIASLESRRNEIADIQRQAELKKLMDAISQSGMSVSDAIEKLIPSSSESA